ncbi:hypothetical protein TWF102_001290 [Orbilia oligospora]|uniref:B30.2/SPRY domain-containing protein n=1 Tax=Orbilia oligospora TaxID=2813651 RepID=A0A7C8IYH4_ORBOL|nr:hypothetical protein TWF102_001290 [Orbilia oligospora]KAF3087682.1 hypothetical protein TWF103_001372 [Orbilia oligospora]
MVQLGITSKPGKGASPISSGEDPDNDFEDEKNITIKVLETEDTPTTSSWEKAKAIFREKLEAEEGGKLKKSSLEFLNEVVTPQQAIAQCEKTKERADKEYSSKKEVVVAGKKLNIKEKMVKILRKMSMFVAIGDVVFEHSPDTSAVVWSAIRLILEIALDDINTCGLLIDAVDEITGAMFAAEIYEQRYHKAEADGEKTGKNEAILLGSKVLEKIVPLYADILYFSYYSKKYIQHGKLVRLLKGITKPIAVLQGILDGITKKLGEMHTVAGLVFQEQSLEALEGLAATTKLEGEETRNFIRETMFKSNRDITDLKDAVLRSLANEEMERLNAEFAENEKWLDPLQDLHYELNSNRAKRQKGTCGWVFDQDEYKQWYNSTQSSFLWVYGNAGFGKSVLMSAIVDGILEGIGKETSQKVEVPSPPLIASFFCKVGSEKTQKTFPILKSLIYQYYQYCKHRMPQEILVEASSRIKEAAKKEMSISNSPSNATGDSVQEIWKKLILDLGKLFNSPIYIIIDALDECDDREKTGFISLLQNVARSSSRTKVVVTSRQEPDIVTLLSHGPKISVEEQKNIKDVKVYVKKELKKVTILREKERKDAHKAIVKRASGMFRYAALAIQSLQQPWARPLSKHLKNLPDQMAEFYQRSLDQMESQQKEVLITALRWAICADGDITVQQIAEDFSNVFLEAVEEPENEILVPEIEDGENSDDDDDDEDDDDDDSDDEDEDTNEDDDENRIGNKDGNKVNGVNQLDLPAKEVIGALNSSPLNENPSSSESAKDIKEKPLYSEAELKSRLRQPIEHVKNSRGIFFYVGDDDVVRLTHTTVRDFVEDNAKKYMEESSKLVSCSKCLKDLENSSTLRCAPKWGHLLIALTIVRHLNSPEFQERYMSWDQYWDGGDEIAPESDEPEPEPELVPTPDQLEGTNSTEPSEAQTFSSGIPEANPIGIETESGEAVINGDDPILGEIIPPSPVLVTEATDFDTQPGSDDSQDEVDVESLNVVGQESHPEDPVEVAATESWAPSEADTDYGVKGKDQELQEDEAESSKVLRYEVQKWIAHVAKAEKLWTKDEKKNSKEWQELITGLKKLSSNKKVFRFIQRHVFSENWDKWTISTGYANPLSVFSWNEAPSVVEELLKDADKDEVNFTFPGGYFQYRSALQFAAEGECPETTKMLLDAGADLNWKSRTGATTLDCTYSRGTVYFDNLKLLIESGADVVQAEREGHKQSCLHYIVHSGSPQATKLLLEHGARINARDSSGETPLHWALFAPKDVRKEIVTLLLENGADINMLDNEGQAPLFEAALMGSVEMLELLIKYKADLSSSVEFEKYNKWNLLHAAVYSSDLTDNIEATQETCLYLMEKGVDLMHQDINGETPLHTAVRLSLPKPVDDINLKLVATLLPKYIEKDPSRAFLHLGDSKQRTLLHRIAAAGKLEMAKLLLDCCSDPTELLELKEKSGSTPIFPAVYKGLSSMVKYLIEKGANVSVTNKHGNSLMSRAINGLWQFDNVLPSANGAREETIAALIRTEPQKYKTNYSLVVITAILKSEILLNALVEIGLDFSAVDEFGWSWAMYALAYGFDRETLISKNIAAPNIPTTFPTPEEEWRGRLPSKLVVSSSILPEKYRVDQPGTSSEGTIIDVASMSLATDNPIPFGVFQYYYEVTFLDFEGSPYDMENGRCPGEIYLGFVQDNPNLESGQVGGEFSKYSKPDPTQEALHGEAFHRTGLYGYPWGWNLTDGVVLHGYGRYDTGYTPRDRDLPFCYGNYELPYTIGCGFDSENKRIWFTRNGDFIGIAFKDVIGRLWPTIGILNEAVKVQVNFGDDLSAKPFKYDYKTRLEIDVARWMSEDKLALEVSGGRWEREEDGWIEYMEERDPKPADVPRYLSRYSMRDVWNLMGKTATGLYLLVGIAHTATIPNYKPNHQEIDRLENSAKRNNQPEISTEKHHLSKRSPAPPYSPGGSNENSIDEIDPRGDRRPLNREEDEESNGPWDMFGNVSPGTLGVLRTHTDLVQNLAPQNVGLGPGLGLGLQVPRPAININAGGGNAPQQAARQNAESSSEAEEEEKAATEIEEEEKSNTEIEEEEKEASDNNVVEPEESEDTEIEEEEKEATDNLENYGQDQNSQRSISHANSASLQSPNYFLPNVQPNLADLNRRPYLLESPDINSRFAPSSNSGGRSRSSPTRQGRRMSELFGDFDPSTIRDASGNNQLYRANRNRQSFSSPASDILDFGGNSLLSRFNSGEGPLMRPITLNFGHESAYPNIQTNQVTEMRDDLFSQSLDDEFPPPRSLTGLQANQPQRNDQPSRGTAMVDITGGLGGPPIYRQEEVKEESDSNSLDSQET